MIVSCILVIANKMSIFDFLKRKKEIDKSREKRPEKVLDAKKPQKEKASPVVRITGLKKREGFSYDIIKEPHISEKSSNLGEKNTYVFKTRDGANKMEIRKAVEGIYGVDVLSVNVIKIPKKKRRIGRTEGYKKGYAKAVVKVKEGQSIELL